VLDNQNYFCSRCGNHTRRSRTRWIKHLKTCDPDEFEAILESLRVVNDAVQLISDNSNQVRRRDFIDIFELSFL